MLLGADHFCEICLEMSNSTMKLRLLQPVRCAQKRDLMRDIAENVRSQM